MTRDEALSQALAELEIDSSYRRDVIELLETPREAWPACCGLLCDPCVLGLAKVVERVQQLCS